ncbi:MAG TPA: holo-ACP synthase [Myxococcota bacterium]
MIAGVGLDIVDVRAFASLFGADAAARARFVAATFTDAEARYCEREGLGDPIAHFAVRFAAKEATLKALDCAASSLGLAPAAVAVVDVEVVRDERGRPAIRLHGAAYDLCAALEIARLHVSLSHDGGSAAAVVVAERAP